MAKRIKLKVLRITQDLSQSQMAEKLGCTSQFYSLVENGKRKGNEEFWKKLRHEFNLSPAEVWCMQNNEEE